MKKIITFILALIVCATTATAEFDLSGMSFEELTALQQQVQLAIWASDGWQEVEVPAGVYEIGVDIPAGRWTIKTLNNDATWITWGTGLDEYKVSIPWDCEIADEYLYKQQLHWQLTEGTFLHIRPDSVIFTPYVGVDLGFK